MQRVGYVTQRRSSPVQRQRQAFNASNGEQGGGVEGKVWYGAAGIRLQNTLNRASLRGTNSTELNGNGMVNARHSAPRHTNGVRYAAPGTRRDKMFSERLMLKCGGWESRPGGGNQGCGCGKP